MNRGCSSLISLIVNSSLLVLLFCGDDSCCFRTALSHSAYFRQVCTYKYIHQRRIAGYLRSLESYRRPLKYICMGRAIHACASLCFSSTTAETQLPESPENFRSHLESQTPLQVWLVDQEEWNPPTARQRRKSKGAGDEGYPRASIATTGESCNKSSGYRGLGGTRGHLI